MSDLVVELYGTRVGTLRGVRREFDFITDPEGMGRFGIGSTVLSIAVPLESVPPRGTVHLRRAFFEEILAEGHIRDRLAANARIDPSNTMALLARYGRDVAGAVQIWDESDPAEPRIPEFRPVAEQEIEGMLDDVALYPLGNSGRRRLSSLAGVQDKIVLVRTLDGWAEPLDGYPSTHLIKPQSGRFRSLIFDEEYGSRFARGLGLASFDTHLAQFGGVQALVIERYDRDDSGRRTHQEDFNQVLGHVGDEKYEEGAGDHRLLRIATVLREHASRVEVRKLAQMVTLSLALGNLDMHAKNISLLHSPDGEVALAPMYDVVPQLHMGLDETVALMVNGKHDFASITGSDLIAEIQSWGLRDARVIVEDTLERIDEIAAREQPHPAADPSLVSLPRHRVSMLRATMAVSSGAPPTGSARPEVFPARNAPGGWGGPVQ